MALVDSGEMAAGGGGFVADAVFYFYSESKPNKTNGLNHLKKLAHLLLIFFREEKKRTMGCRLRLFEPNIVNSTVTRCVDRQFLFTPNHDPGGHVLLAGDCSPQSLNPSNGLIPRPSIINIIGAAAARAQELAPVDLHWLEGNVNHLHSGFSLTDETLDNGAKFQQILNSTIARKINLEYERDGHFWGARYRTTPCVDDVSAGQQFFYSLINPVKDGLVSKVKHSPFFNTFRYWTTGKEQKYWFIDYATYYKNGGKENKNHRLKEYLKWRTLKLTPLPEWQGMQDHQIQTMVRKTTKLLEEQAQDKLKSENRIFLGQAKIFKTDPRQRPKNPNATSGQPLCHASTKENYENHKEKWNNFQKEHIKASADFRNGLFEREFPTGSYRPRIAPIENIYTKSKL